MVSESADQQNGIELPHFAKQNKGRRRDSLLGIAL
jgi:hypothetical protein